MPVEHLIQGDYYERFSPEKQRQRVLRQKPALCSGFATDTTHQPVAFSTLPLHTGGDKRGMPWTPRILRCVHGNACGAGRTATDAVPLNRRVAKDLLLDAHSGYDMLVEPAFDGVAKAAREPPDWLAPTLSRTWALGLVPQGWLGGDRPKISAWLVPVPWVSLHPLPASA